MLPSKIECPCLSGFATLADFLTIDGTLPVRARIRFREARVPLLISAACVIPACLSIAQGYASAKLDGHATRWDDVAFSGGDWIALAPLIPFAYWLGRRFPVARSRWIARAALHVCGALALAVAWASLGMLLGLALHHYPALQPMARSYANWILITVPFAVLIYLAVQGSTYAYANFVEARELEADAAAIAAQLANARLGALRMQLHPHFLFNTLNTTLVLVREKNIAGAGRTLELLGDLLREVLRTDRPHEIPLEDELRFLEQYLAIEQVRFSDRLHVGWSIDPDARTGLVPEFVLQPIVENAVRHGFAKRGDASTISVEAHVVDTSLELLVIDDGAGFDQSAPEHGLGLSNTRERLGALYGDAAGITITSSRVGTRVVVRIPFRTVHSA
jgi:two-component system, LytTR family, sensor kinase